MLKDRDLIVAAFLIFRCGGGLPCGTSLLLVLLEPLDESVRGAIMLQFCVILGEFRKDLLRELLAEFNTPLVVAVDVPDHALSEDFVFVHGNESAETFRRNVVHHDGVRGVGLRTP